MKTNVEYSVVPSAFVAYQLKIAIVHVVFARILARITNVLKVNNAQLMCRMMLPDNLHLSVVRLTSRVSVHVLANRKGRIVVESVTPMPTAAKITSVVVMVVVLCVFVRRNLHHVHDRQSQLLRLSSIQVSRRWFWNPKNHKRSMYKRLLVESLYFVASLLVVRLRMLPGPAVMCW